MRLLLRTHRHPIRLTLPARLNVKRDHSVALVLEQYSLPPLSELRWWPAGEMILNDEFRVASPEPVPVKGARDVVDFLNGLIDRHNANFRQKFAAQIARAANYSHFHMIQAQLLRRTKILARLGNTNPAIRDPQARARAWAEILAENAVSRRVRNYLEHEDLKYRINAGIFHDFTLEGETFVIPLRPTQKIVMSEEWRKLFVDPSIIHRKDRSLSSPLRPYRWTALNLGKLDPYNPRELACLCEQVEPTVYDNRVVPLLETVRGAVKKKPTLAGLQRNRAFLKLGSYVHLDLRFTEPGGKEVTFAPGLTFLKLAVLTDGDH